MKGGVTKRIEEATKALDNGQLKHALQVLDKDKTREQYNIVANAARNCLSNQESCSTYLQDANSKLKSSITSDATDTSLEGVQEMLDEKGTKTTDQAKGDNELYEDCQECHIADAVGKTSDVCNLYRMNSCQELEQAADNPDTAPEQWLGIIRNVHSEATGEAKQGMDYIVNELAEYLKRKDSEYLRHLTDDQ